jgi:hypothetical protein
MAENDVHAEQGRRLKAARKAAGFRSAAAAVKSAPIKEKWKKSTYTAHERGSRTIGQDDAERYARFFRAHGAEVTAVGLLFGTQDQIIEAAKAEMYRFLKRLAEKERELQQALPPHHTQPQLPQEAVPPARKSPKKSNPQNRP